MGFTKGLSFRKFLKLDDKNMSILSCSFLSMRPVLLSYLLASYLSDICISHVNDNFLILNNIVNFNAGGPFYFVGLFIELSLWAPFLYFILDRCGKYQGVKGTLMVVLCFLGTWIVGYASIDVCDIFGQSYLTIYTIGMFASMIELPQRSIRLLIGSTILTMIGVFFCVQFYFARVAGDYSYAKYIDILCPKLQINPPNLSIIIYSLGVVCVLYCVALYIENVKYLNLPFMVIALLGQYSLDIFLWHIFIRQSLNIMLLDKLGNIWIKRIVYYFAMFFIPIFMREVYTIVVRQIKNLNDYEVKK